MCGWFAVCAPFYSAGNGRTEREDGNSIRGKSVDFVRRLFRSRSGVSIPNKRMVCQLSGQRFRAGNPGSQKATDRGLIAWLLAIETIIAGSAAGLLRLAVRIFILVHQCTPIILVHNYPT